MILVDANLLIYAVHSNSPHHVAARHWLEETLSGTAHVGLPWIVALAFLRITTRGAIVEKPLTPERAIAYVDSWLDLPRVDLIAPGDGHWPILRNLLRTTGMAGNLTSDAHVAALALEHGAAVYSADHDFGRFPGIEHVDPLSDG
ncbi:MAG TPA: type II toxin-antitoxin system VapC family toxin [Thermoanaerobaculia bacterium]|nr:type II toxin-antitoxin system VapC family toxin [Thermoanaerobaculia bacterium]